MDARQYPSPLSSYRHYNKDLEDESLIRVSNMPKEARVRLGAMDVYDGTTFGMGVTNTADGTAGAQRRYGGRADLGVDLAAAGTVGAHDWPGVGPAF